MATPHPPPTERTGLPSGDGNDGTTSTLSRGLLFTTHSIFGILALGGCLMVQCLLVTWFALLTAQTHSLNLQARMFKYVYGMTVEKAQSERKKRKKNVIRIEITPPQGTNAQVPQTIKKDFSFDERISLNIRPPVPKAPLLVKDPLPLKPEVTPFTPRWPLSASSPKPHELRPEATEVATTSVALPTPKVRLPVSNPNWQTKSVQQRKGGGGRGYAVKQVDVFTPGNDEPLKSFLEEPNSERDEPFGFLAPAASSSAIPQRVGSFLGHTPATAVASPPFRAFSFGDMPSFLTPQKPAPMPRPVVKLPGMSPSSGNKLNAPKRELDLQSSALENEQHPANSAPKRARRSMVKLVKTETPLQMPPRPQPSSDQDLAKIQVEEPPKLTAPIETSKVEEPPKLTAPVETSNVNWIEPLQPAASVTQPEISQDTSGISSPVAEPTLLVNVEPVDTKFGVDEPLERSIFDRANDIASASTKSTAFTDVEPVQIGQLRHRFLDTSVLRETPIGKPELKLSPAIAPVSPEEVAREALIVAFSERESARVELSRNYYYVNVNRFIEKAREYKERRKALASLMPSGNLSFEDEASFPYLSTKDTQEPVVPSPTVSESQRPFPLPSPPTSSEEDNEQHTPREDPGPLLAKAARAYQVLLKATKNMEDECLDCHSKFCLNAYSPAGQRKMKSAKDLYQKSLSRLRDAYESRQPPESLANQYPEVGGC